MDPGEKTPAKDSRFSRLRPPKETRLKATGQGGSRESKRVEGAYRLAATLTNPLLAFLRPSGSNTSGSKPSPFIDEAFCSPVLELSAILLLNPNPPFPVRIISLCRYETTFLPGQSFVKTIYLLDDLYTALPYCKLLLSRTTCSRVRIYVSFLGLCSVKIQMWL